MEDLRTEYKNIKNIFDFIEQILNNSEKNSMSINYVAGIIDTARFLNKINIVEYNLLYKKYIA